MRRAVAVAAVVGAVWAGVGCSRGGDEAEVAGREPRLPGQPAPATEATRRTAAEWDKQAEGAYAGFDNALRRLVESAREWTAGLRPSEVFASDVREVESRFLHTRDAVTRLPRLEFAPEVSDLYGASARLYLELARVYEVALTSDPLGDDVRGELTRLADRLRLLADRTFDRARALLVPHLDMPTSEDVEVRLPDEVPDWAAEGLAPGSPLEDTEPAAPTGPRIREADRPEQSFKEWLSVVEAQRLTNGLQLAEMMESGDTALLRDEARRLVTAAEHLRGVPDPKGGGRELSARLRLTLLVHADAARLTQAAAFIADPGQADAARSIARRVAAAGDMVWPRAAGFRSTGFPADVEEGL